MANQAFDQIAGVYREKAQRQQQAALKLMSLLHIGSRDNVLDAACGPGHLTYALRKSTRGQVMGVDVSEGMIAKARELYPDIDFRVMAAEDLRFCELFHVVFCNSAMQWFRQPEKALRAFYTALKPGGRLGVAGPATAAYSPFWMDVVAEAARHGEVAPVFAHWRNPWFFLPDEDAYQDLFEQAGFATEHLEIVREISENSVEEAWGNFLSGAANGYLGNLYYDIDISDTYIRVFQQEVRQAVTARAKNGRVKVDFNRLYYVGSKPAAAE